jgi:CheY-like chemotaxis protein
MGQGKSVLVVEDDKDVRENMAFVLEGEGHTVLQAEHGQAALDLLRRSPPDQLPSLIILDLMMPVMDGKSLLMALRAEGSKELTKIPVLIASARGNLDYEMKDFPEVAGNLQKPMDIDDLFAAVDRYGALPS